MRIPRRVVSVMCGLLLVLGASTAVGDDVTITYKVAYGERGTPIRHKYISLGRAEAWSGPDYGFITESTGKKTRIDHTTWQYTETTQQEEDEAFRLLQRLPSHSTPLKSSSVTFQKLPDHRRVAGLECDHYVVTTRRQWDDPGAEPRIVVNRHDYWIAPDLHLETARARSFEMGAGILQDAPQGVVEDVLSKGLVLAETWSVDDRIFRSEEAIEFKIGAIDPSVFRPSLFYSKVESLSASLIRANAGVEYSEVGACTQTLFIAVGTDNDENIAWDTTKKAWRSCVTERLGEKWTVVQKSQKQCYPRQEKTVALSRIVAQGTEIVSCGSPRGDPQGKWICHLDAVPCTAPGPP
jgi:hypothetical protein